MTNPTLQFPQNQPKKRQFGRIPVDLLSKIQALSNQEAKVFLVLSMLANYKREPIGMVECQSLSDLAKTIGVPRKSFYRAIEGLMKCGMVTRPGPDTCVVVTHYLRHDDPLPEETETSGHTPVSSCLTETPGAPKESTTSKAPIRSEEVSEEEVTIAVAELPVKKKQKRSLSWLVWSVEKDKLVTRNGDSNGNQEFMDRWKERLGEEDIIWAEKEKAEKWLRDNPEKRINTKSFERFFGNWLNKRWEAS